MSVLGEETEDGFKVVKKFANKFGQGLLNMVSNSSTNKMDLYMKKVKDWLSFHQLYFK